MNWGSPLSNFFFWNIGNRFLTRPILEVPLGSFQGCKIGSALNQHFAKATSFPTMFTLVISNMFIFIQDDDPRWRQFWRMWKPPSIGTRFWDLIKVTSWSHDSPRDHPTMPMRPRRHCQRFASVKEMERQLFHSVWVKSCGTSQNWMLGWCTTHFFTICEDFWETQLRNFYQKNWAY